MADELEMSSQRRLLTAMRCKQPDRIPIHVRGVRAWDDEWVASRDVSYKPLIDAVREHCDWVVGWGVSAGWFLTAFPELHIETQVHDAGDWVLHETIAHTPKGPLTHIRKVSKHDYPPLTHKFWVTCEEDLERFLSVPYVPPEPDVQSFFDLTRRIGERGIVMVSLLDPIGYVHDLLGSELLAIWSIERRDIIMQLVEMFTQRLYELISYLIARGVRGVFGMAGEEYVSPSLHPPKDFHEFVTIPERQLSQLIHNAGSLLHIHCHGPLNAVLEEFIEIGANCLHPIEPPPMGDVNLSEAKERIGRRVCLEGNIQIGDIYTATSQQIRDSVLRAIDEAADGGGFILCPTASPYTKVLPANAITNYLTMIETALEYGCY